jgi:hypothetical protein
VRENSQQLRFYENIFVFFLIVPTQERNRKREGERERLMFCGVKQEIIFYVSDVEIDSEKLA